MLDDFMKMVPAVIKAGKTKEFMEAAMVFHSFGMLTSDWRARLLTIIPNLADNPQEQAELVGAMNEFLSAVFATVHSDKADSMEILKKYLK